MVIYQFYNLFVLSFLVKLQQLSSIVDYYIVINERLQDIQVSYNNAKQEGICQQKVKNGNTQQIINKSQICVNQPLLKISNNIQQYQRLIGGLFQPQIITISSNYPLQNILSNLQQALFEHNIHWQRSRFTLCQFQIMDINYSNFRRTYTYNIGLSYFTIQIQVYNSMHSHNDVFCTYGYSKTGSFGQVYEIFDPFLEKQVVVKQITYDKAEYMRIQSHLNQIAFVKLFSALKIGPKHQKIFGFDLIQRQKSVLFSMEKGIEISDFKRHFERKQSQFQAKDLNVLKQNIKLMHSLSIVHMDIKPSNIVYSEVFQKLVFIDFGITEAKYFKKGITKQQYFRGTLAYCSEELGKLYASSQSNYIDLFHNDAVCLSKSLRQIAYDLNYKEEISNVDYCNDQNNSSDSFIQNQSIRNLINFRNKSKFDFESNFQYDLLNDSLQGVIQPQKQYWNLSFLKIRIMHLIFSQNFKGFELFVGGNYDVVNYIQKKCARICEMFLQIAVTEEAVKTYQKYFKRVIQSQGQFLLKQQIKELFQAVPNIQIIHSQSQQNNFQKFKQEIQKKQATDRLIQIQRNKIWMETAKIHNLHNSRLNIIMNEQKKSGSNNQNKNGNQSQLYLKELRQFSAHINYIHYRLLGLNRYTRQANIKNQLLKSAKQLLNQEQFYIITQEKNSKQIVSKTIIFVLDKLLKKLKRFNIYVYVFKLLQTNKMNFPQVINLKDLQALAKLKVKQFTQLLSQQIHIIGWYQMVMYKYYLLIKILIPIMDPSNKLYNLHLNNIIQYILSVQRQTEQFISQSLINHNAFISDSIIDAILYVVNKSTLLNALVNKFHLAFNSNNILQMKSILQISLRIASEMPTDSQYQVHVSYMLFTQFFFISIRSLLIPIELNAQCNVCERVQKFLTKICSKRKFLNQATFQQIYYYTFKLAESIYFINNDYDKSLECFYKVMQLLVSQSSEQTQSNMVNYFLFKKINNDKMVNYYQNLFNKKRSDNDIELSNVALTQKIILKHSNNKFQQVQQGKKIDRLSLNEQRWQLLFEMSQFNTQFKTAYKSQYVDQVKQVLLAISQSKNQNIEAYLDQYFSIILKDLITFKQFLEPDTSILGPLQKLMCYRSKQNNDKLYVIQIAVKGCYKGIVNEPYLIKRLNQYTQFVTFNFQTPPITYMIMLSQYNALVQSRSTSFTHLISYKDKFCWDFTIDKVLGSPQSFGFYMSYLLVIGQQLRQYKHQKIVQIFTYLSKNNKISFLLTSGYYVSKFILKLLQLQLSRISIQKIMTSNFPKQQKLIVYELFESLCKFINRYPCKNYVKFISFLSGQVEKLVKQRLLTQSKMVNQFLQKFISSYILHDQDIAAKFMIIYFYLSIAGLLVGFNPQKSVKVVKKMSLYIQNFSIQLKDTIRNKLYMVMFQLYKQTNLKKSFFCMRRGQILNNKVRHIQRQSLYKNVKAIKFRKIIVQKLYKRYNYINQKLIQVLSFKKISQ